MTADVVDFHAVAAPAPDYEQVARQYRELENELDTASGAEQIAALVQRWDRMRRELDTWRELTHLHFNQDTRNAEYKRAREFCDELRPKLTDLDTRIKRRLVTHGQRPALEALFGSQAFALWECAISTFDPVIEADLVEEAKLEATYVELLASAELEFEGCKYNLSEFGKFREHPQRAVRETTERIRWQWFANQRVELDRIFARLVRLRTEMARKLGFANFVELGYRRMARIDYEQSDVARFRDAVRQFVTPLGVELRQRQAARLGIDPLMYWDEAIHDPAGNPAPRGDHDWMIQRATEMFDAMGGGLGEFFSAMRQGDWLDLKSRDGKAGGGFCTSLPSIGMPFIFANFNGTKGDVEVFTHEMGHAFQGYLSRVKPLTEYLWPTFEACEIHSMGLEYLTWPHMEKFFGDDAERFRRIHLAQSLLFLPYGVAVDHFQHLVYGAPDATPAERVAMWRYVESTYLPWRNYGDLPHVAEGGMWQLQRHIYLHPFYYIDYTLAQTCALQLWLHAHTDFAGTLQRYVALCGRGGEAPFRELVRSAGLISPFEPGCLSEVVAQARAGLSD
jgi:M3 family oligoendopeptidase